VTIALIYFFIELIPHKETLILMEADEVLASPSLPTELKQTFVEEVP
jgi:hypothetical protein